MTSVFGIKGEDLLSPSQFVDDPLAFRLRCRPQFEVPLPVVVADSVAVVYLLLREETPTEMRRHDNVVLSCPTLAVGAGHPDADLDQHVTAGVLALSPDRQAGAHRSDRDVGSNVASANTPRVVRTAEASHGGRPFASGCRTNETVPSWNLQGQVRTQVAPAVKAVRMPAAVEAPGAPAASFHGAEAVGGTLVGLEGDRGHGVAMGLEASVMTGTETALGRSAAAFDGTKTLGWHTARYKPAAGAKATVLGADL